eukprot:scaffold268736_cov26-Tisochrysis_lutea.AAC.1
MGTGTMYANSLQVQIEYFSLEQEKMMRRWVPRAHLTTRRSTSSERAASSASNSNLASTSSCPSTREPAARHQHHLQ